MSYAALKRRAREARDWMMDSCFPLWAEEGVGPNGLFLEVLDLSHRPVLSETTRVRVQARQTYVFAEALRMGWEPQRSRRLVEMGLNTLTTAVRRSDGLVGRTLSTETKSLLDDRADLYDIAFVLFALSKAGHVSPEAASAHVTDLLASVDKHVRDTQHGGYFEMLPRPDKRLQNPHMHLLEACHALHEADPISSHLRRAEEIIDLFGKHFTDDPTGTLGEHFKLDWSAENGDAHDVIEPGHQFEWVWLLHRHALLTRQEAHSSMKTLYDFGLSTLDEEGRAIQSVRRDGSIVDASRRTWPQTETLKAHLAMLERTGDEACLGRAISSCDVLMDEYLTPEGGWIDHYDSDGHVLAKDMPASTGYHVVLAMAELIRVTGV